MALKGLAARIVSQSWLNAGMDPLSSSDGSQTSAATMMMSAYVTHIEVNVRSNAAEQHSPIKPYEIAVRTMTTYALSISEAVTPPSRKQIAVIGREERISSSRIEIEA